ncbi:MAG: sugar phosphate isomerase/epimerase [Planctomycetota bacterium]|nr:sugar phosphate isomerase/epimerase [Planctomycetota bacterium]
MRIATSLNVFLNRCEPEAGIPRLAAAGFDGLDFNFCDLLEQPWHDGPAADRWLEKLAAAASKAGMSWVQAHGPMFNMFSAEAPNPARMALVEPCLRACGRLGVPWMVHHPDVFAGPFDAAHRMAVRERNAAYFRALLPACEKHGVGIAIENIFDSAASGRGCPRFYGAVPDELCELIDAIDHPLVGACWDTGHARLMGLEQRTALSTLGKRLKVVHVQENDGKGDDHMLPFANGRGGVDWEAVTAGMRAAGFAHAWTFEVARAFQTVPEELFDAQLRWAVDVARHLIARVERG